MSRLIPTFLLLLLLGLSFTLEVPRSNLRQGESSLDSSRVDASNEVTIALIATNDIHGTAYPTEMIRSDTKEKYTYGGLIYMASMFDIVRNQYGASNTLWLDAGDQFQGGIESSHLVSNGKIMNEFFNAESLDGAAIGNHEFDYGQQFLQSYLKNNVESFVSANMYSETGEPVTRFMPNTKRSKIVAMSNGVKVGVIGLTTVDTPQTSSGFTDHMFPDYQFKEYADIVAQEAKALRDSGAWIVVVVAHEGDHCPTQSLNNSIWKNTTVQEPCPDGQISEMIEKLPRGTIDAVVQGHRHEIIHFYKNGVPIAGSTNGGYYFNIIHLTINKKTKKVVDSSIEGPIPVCDKIFSNTNRCDYVRPEDISRVGNLVPWKFHNVIVTPSSRMRMVFNEWAPYMAPYLQELVQNNVYLKSEDTKECGLCNLFSDLMLEAAPKADFSLINPGGLRTIWLPGVIQYQHFYNMSPFNNSIQTFVITGAELKSMFQILQGGKFGFYSTSGLKMTVTSQPKGLVNISETNGFEIVDERNYVGVTLDFLLKGGDDMQEVIQSKAYVPREVMTLGDLKTLTKPLLIKRKILTEKMLIDPQNPRLIFV